MLWLALAPLMLLAVAAAVVPLVVAMVLYHRRTELAPVRVADFAEHRAAERAA